MKISNKLFYVMLLGTVAFNLAGCSGGSSSSGTTSPASGVKLTGLVSAPGSTTGAIAFAPAEKFNFRNMFASLFVSQVQAGSVSGTAPVGAGVKVDLIEIDNAGVQVGAIIATSTTASDGSYTIDTGNSAFAAASKYVVRATSATDSSKHIDAIVTSTAVNVDPVTDATKALIISNSIPLASMTPENVAELVNTVGQLVNSIDTAAFTNVAATQAAIIAKANSNIEATNYLANATSAGGVSGTVKDSSGTALPNIQIVVRDFITGINEAVTRTDATGAYTVHVPAGVYIVAAFNRTSTSTAASEFWTSGGGANNFFSAEKFTVAATSVTKDFVLDPGVRISGTVTGAVTGAPPVKGMFVQIRDFLSDEPVGGTFTNDAGSYIINVRPSIYTIGVYNTTIQPYATQLYNASLSGGGSNSTQAEKIDLSTAGQSKMANLSLSTGSLISGQVLDAPTGAPVVNITVRFYTASGGFVYGMHTDKAGKYGVWLRPNGSSSDPYSVRTRGKSLPVDISATSQIQNFTDVMTAINATVTDGISPVSQAKVTINNATGYAYQDFQITQGDGTVTLYAPSGTSVYAEIKIDNGSHLGSILTSAMIPATTKRSVAAASPLVIGATTYAGGTMTLSAGGVLTGVVSKTASGAVLGNASVKVFDGAISSANYFTGTRTQVDGSYSLSLPAGTTYTVQACDNPTPPTASTCTAGVALTIDTAVNSGDVTLPELIVP